MIRRVYYHPCLEGHRWGREVLSRLSHLCPEPKDRQALKEDLLRQSSDPMGEGKEVLYLSPFRGSLFKPCPGTRGYTCCGYFVANVVVGCPMDCSYCILQGYLQEPYITLNLPWQGIFREVEGHRGFLRLGTGELSDSLALEPLVGFAREAVEFFSRREGLLELKTKTDRVEGLLGLEHRGRTVMAWSVNPERLIQGEEHGTAPLRRRLGAARRCQEAGYPLAFHLDPIIHYPGWEEDYRDLVEELFRWVDPKGVIWVSLGTLRLPPGLEGIIRGRFPRSVVLTGELLPAEDGKLRYLKPLRVDIYRKVLGWIRDAAPGVFVYLCMEREDVWEATFGWRPGGTRGLKALFDSHGESFLRRWR